MLIIPTYFKPYVKGHPYPQLVVVQACEECEWVFHANRNKHQNVLDKEWATFAAFHGLKEGDCLMFKVTADEFKMKIYDRITSYRKVFIYREHAHLV